MSKFSFVKQVDVDRDQFFAISTAYDLDQRGNICISKNAANALNVLSGDTVGIA